MDSTKTESEIENTKRQIREKAQAVERAVAGVDRPVSLDCHSKLGSWVGDLRALLSRLGLAAPVSDEELTADLDAQMRRVLRAVDRLYEGAPPPGYRLQALPEFDAIREISAQNDNLSALVRQMAYSLIKLDPGNARAESAMRYLDRIGKRGNVLRDVDAPHKNQQEGDATGSLLPLLKRL
jgi:hypothetical protein